MRQFAQSLFTLLLIISVSSHLVLLQSLAWTNMLFSRMGNMPLPQAIAETFDGKHPCKMCKMVSNENKKSEDSTSDLVENKVSKKYLLVESLISIIKISHPINQKIPFTHVSYLSHKTYPLTPPPKV